MPGVLQSKIKRIIQWREVDFHGMMCDEHEPFF